MHRLVSLTSTLVGLMLCTLAAPAHAGRAGVPSPANSTIPTLIMLVGHRVGVPDPAGEFVVVNRDLANNPVAGAQVVCDFSGCTDLRIAAQQPYPGLQTDCTTRTVRATTDATGTARFCIVGGASNPGAAPGSGTGALRIYAGGVLLGSVSVAAPDENGFDGLNANDLSAWAADYLARVWTARSDFDGGGTLGANDAATWMARFMSGDSVQGAASLPGGVCP